jgi:hypothetical protein
VCGEANKNASRTGAALFRVGGAQKDAGQPDRLETSGLLDDASRADEHANQRRPFEEVQPRQTLN